MAAHRELDMRDRRHETRHVLEMLEPNSRLDGIALDVSHLVYDAACDLVAILGDGPELTLALRALWSAKNLAVMQALYDSRQVGNHGHPDR